MRPRVIENDEVYSRAIRHRKVFHGSVAGRKHELSDGWPPYMVHVGKCAAQLYWSNKKLSGGRWELYKHIAEAGQDLFYNPETTQLFSPDGDPVQLEGDKFELDGMPRYITELAQDRGLQAVLNDGEYYEIMIPKAMWGAATYPGTGDLFLVLYSVEGVHFMVTGVKLNITEHGIVG